MNINVTSRNQFYWHLLIQWLAKQNILNEFLDARIERASTRRCIDSTALAVLTDLCEDATEASASQIQMANLMTNINREQNCTALSDRFFPAYAYVSLVKEGHEFHTRRWGLILEHFTDTLRQNGVLNLRATRIETAYRKAIE